MSDKQKKPQTQSLEIPKKEMPKTQSHCSFWTKPTIPKPGIFSKDWSWAKEYIEERDRIAPMIRLGG